MLEHGVIVSYETGRRWRVKFGQRYADSLRQYLWRAVDPDGKVLGILVQKRQRGPWAGGLSPSPLLYAVTPGTRAGVAGPAGLRKGREGRGETEERYGAVADSRRHVKRPIKRVAQGRDQGISLVCVGC